MANWRVISVITLVAFLQSHFTPAWAAPTSTSKTKTSDLDKEAEQIPKKPTAPPSLIRKVPAERSFQCDRQFTHKGKTYDCDSFFKQDAEGLRPIIQDVPEAVMELNAYQATRRNLRTMAYVSTAGFVIALTGLLAGSRFKDPDGRTSSTGHSIRNIGLIGGLGIAAGSLIYGISLIKTNETRLGSAVQSYNTAHPETPIELQFSTGITF